MENKNSKYFVIYYKININYISRYNIKIKNKKLIYI